MTIKTKKNKHQIDKHINNKNNIEICYTGIGSNNKNPMYTKSTFMELANKTFKKECIDFHVGKKCKPCNDSSKVLNLFMKKASVTKKYNQWPPKLKNKYINLQKKCDLCKKKTKKQKNCSLDEYIKYSGAIIGKC